MSHKRFVKIGLVVLPLLMVGKHMRLRACRMAGGPPGEKWARHWPHMHHGPMPPWHPGWKERFGEETQGPEPDMA